MVSGKQFGRRFGIWDIKTWSEQLVIPQGQTKERADMYIACKYGFYSLASKPAPQFLHDKPVIHVRAHDKHDLLRLIRRIKDLKLKIQPEIMGRERAGWSYRFFLHPSDLPKVLARLGTGVNYPSFKKVAYLLPHQRDKFWVYDRMTKDMAKAYGIPIPKPG
jgi:hypothetical protein